MFLLSNKRLTYLPGCARVSVDGGTVSAVMWEGGEEVGVRRLYEEEGSRERLGRGNAGGWA